VARDCNFVSALCKGVNETVRVGIDFIDLIVTGETLTDPPTVTVSPAGPTISGQDIVDGQATGSAAEALVAGGTAGTTYKVWFAVTTSMGQTRKKHVTLTVDAE
jgi:hypothetical protein